MEFVWAEIREQTIERWGNVGSALEAEIITWFVKNPERVISNIANVDEQYKSGSVRSPWAVLRIKLQRVDPDRAVVASSSLDRDRQVARAHQWMKNVGMHYDRWEEVEDELFGDRGKLTSFVSSELIEEMHESWTKARPVGEILDEEELLRAEKWKRGRSATTP